MKQDLNPISPGSSDVVADQADQSRRKKQAGRGLQKPELKMTSMIDVVFLLLIFFVVTASFQIDEGTLLANMPGNTTTPPLVDLPPTPMSVELRSSDDGVTYSLMVNGTRVEGASELSAYMVNKLQAGQIANDDLVQIKPQGHVRWQHVVNVFNACVNAELEQVSFAY